MNNIIRLAVVDDHALFRRGLISLLSEMAEFEVVVEAGSGEEAISNIPQSGIDIVLLDINMPEMNGIQAFKALNELCPDVKAIMLTISQDDEDLINSIVAGASGYLLKNTEPEILRRTIKQVFDGNSVLSPEVTSKVMDAVKISQISFGKNLLSAREIEVLHCLARGQKTSQIASELFISSNTVKTHVRHILEKLEVKNRAQAVARAAQLKIL